MASVTAIRAVNFPVEPDGPCPEFYRERLGMDLLADVLPDGTMCRWAPQADQFVGLRPRTEEHSRRWRYPYGRCPNWDHVELYLDGRPDGISAVETHPEALVLADPEERAIEALLSDSGTVEVPGIAEVGLSVVQPERTRDFYELLGFEPSSKSRDDRFVLRAASGQRWVLVDGERPGLSHVGFVLESTRFREVKSALTGYPHDAEGDRLRVTDPAGRELVLVAEPPDF